MRAHRGLSAAKTLAEHGDWSNVRSQLRRYMQLHPRDARAHLMMAEALVKDDLLSTVERVTDAITYLQKIADDSPLAARARTQEARLRLLILHEPSQAERVFREAIRLDPTSFEAHYLLWHLLGLTGRSHSSECEAIFWQVYQLTPEVDRSVRLREWYLSEFGPGSWTAPFDRMMGFLNENEQPSALVEYRRLGRFRHADKDSPMVHAALAQRFWRDGEVQDAAEIIRKASSLNGAGDDPFFIATSVTVSLELGQFEQAERCFSQWKRSRDSYEFWRLHGILDEEIRRDSASAIRAYDAALKIWPGQSDWSLRFRKAHCLDRMGQTEQADDARRSAKTFEELLETDVHQELRKALGDLSDPNQLRKIIDFYQKLGRDREVDSWTRELRKLRDLEE